MQTHQKIASLLMLSSAMLIPAAALAKDAFAMIGAPVSRNATQPLLLRSSERLASHAARTPVNLKLSERIDTRRPAERAAAAGSALLVQR